MLKLNQNVVIGNVQFKGFLEFNSEDSVKNVGTTGSITVPKQLNTQGKDISSLFKKGDIAKISIGYDDNVEPVFEGVLSSLQIDRPIVFQLSGYEWFLSQVNFTKEFSAGSSSKEIVTYVIDKVNKEYNLDLTIEITADITNLPTQRYSNVSGLQIISNLRKEYSIYSYFRGSVLYSGLKYPEFADRKVFKYYLDGVNCNVLSNDLQYEESDSVRVLVQGTSYITDGNDLTTIKVEVGDKGGKTISLSGYNLTKEQLEAKSKDMLENYKKSGYNGSFRALGYPTVNHGDVIELYSDEFPERNGSYLCEKSVISCSSSEGYKQVITLDLKV